MNIYNSIQTITGTLSDLVVSAGSIVKKGFLGLEKISTRLLNSDTMDNINEIGIILSKNEHALGDLFSAGVKSINILIELESWQDKTDYEKIRIKFVTKALDMYMSRALTAIKNLDPEGFKQHFEGDADFKKWIE